MSNPNIFNIQQDFNKIAPLNFAFQNAASDLSSPVSGLTYFNTATKDLSFYNGTNFKKLVYNGGDLGAATATSLAASGTISSSSATAGIGYATGAGGTYTQSTSKTTTVAIPSAGKMSGQITTSNSSLASGATATFTVTNAASLATDDVRVNLISGAATDGTYDIAIDGAANGSFKVRIWNIDSDNASLSEALVIGFSIYRRVIT